MDPRLVSVAVCLVSLAQILTALRVERLKRQAKKNEVKQEAIVGELMSLKLGMQLKDHGQKDATSLGSIANG